jgi:DNA polymerase III sliding clamp (beta) subunit (PCNA family)
MSNAIMTCIHVRPDGIVESSDNYRIARYRIPAIPIKSSFLLPAIAATDLCQYKLERVAEGKGWIHFRTDAGTVISSRVYEGEYDNIDKYMKVKGVKFKMPKNLEGVLERAGIFSHREHGLDDEIKISMGDDLMKVRGQGPFGWFEEVVKIKYEDQPVRFTVNPSFLQMMLKQVRNCILGSDSMRFEGESWEHVIALSAEE